MRYRVAYSSMTSRTESLAETLRLRRVETLQSDAELIRDHPDAAERIQEAQRLIREAMCEQALGRMTLAERDRIMDVLSFAVLSFAVLSMRAQSEHDGVFPIDDAAESH